MAQAALGVQLLDELFEGQILVGVGAQGDVADAGQQGAERGVVGQGGAQGEVLTKKPMRRLELARGCGRRWGSPRRYRPGR